MAKWKTNRRTKKHFSVVERPLLPIEAERPIRTLQEYSDVNRNRILRDYWERRVSQLPPSFWNIEFEGFVHHYDPESFLTLKEAGVTEFSAGLMDRSPRMQINFAKGRVAVEVIIEHELGHVVWNRLENSLDPKAAKILDQWHDLVQAIHEKYPKSKKGYYGDEEELFCEMFSTYRFPTLSVIGEQQGLLKRKSPELWNRIWRFAELLGTSLEGRNITQKDVDEL